jgi:hypothetical protein
MDNEELLRRINALSLKGQEAIRLGRDNYADVGHKSGFRSASLSFIKNLYGEAHTFYKEFDKDVDTDYKSSVSAGINILDSIKDEIENGWLFSFRKIISAEVFSDFLEMSKYLLDEKYKDPAAVMIGSVLEEHLRFLCTQHSIDITYESDSKVKPRKADILNSDLAKQSVYGVLEQKSVTAWLDLRNRAAHGKYGEYSLDQVNLMYQGVLGFIISTR